MSNTIQRFFISVPLIILGMVSPQASAVFQNSEHSVAAIQDEGGNNCSNYADNQLIEQMSTNISCENPDEDGMVYGTVGDDYDDDVGYNSDASANWAYNCDTRELSYSDSTVPINFVVTKAGGGYETETSNGNGNGIRRGNGYNSNITWFPYGSDRAWLGDSGIFNQQLGEGGVEVLHMKKFALCYGLPTTSNPEEAGLPDCSSESEDEVINGWLGAINCESLNDGTVVTLWRPTKDGDDEVFQCVCNEGETASTADCDETGSGDSPLLACYTKNNGLTKATTVVEFDSDPVTCTTRNGKRRCKCVDNPFLPGDDCATDSTD